jgi:hypothetical protein
LDGVGAVAPIEPKKPDTSTPKADYSKVLEEAAERFRDVSDRDKENRDNAVETPSSSTAQGNSGPSEVRGKRAKDDPMLEFPQLKQFVHQVVNDQPQARPGIRTHPAGGKASEEVPRSTRAWSGTSSTTATQKLRTTRG